MIRVASLAVALCVFSASGQAQDEGLAGGQKYLEKVAKVWSEKAPAERLLGVYMGRAWIGHARIGIKATPRGDAAAFEMTVKGEMKLADRSMKSEGRALLTASLGVVSAEGKENSDGELESKTLTVSGGKWKLVRTKEEAPKETTGDVKPGMTWEANFLPLWAAPDDDCSVLTLESEKQEVRFKKLAEKQKRSIGGKSGEWSVLQMGKEKEAPDRWFLNDAGQGLELVATDKPVRMRVITEAEMGKDLQEVLELKPAERALVDLFLAIKKNDKAAVESAFDFEKMTAAMVPGYDGMTDEEKKNAVEGMKQQMIDNLLSEQTREQLPDAKTLEEGLAAQVKSEEKEGIASVKLGPQTWKLSEIKEGERKGKWVVIGIEQ